jgi:hypothetical protein
MDNLDQLLGKHVATDFIWKTRNDEFLHPAQMHTKHLYHTLRMIWNHCAPDHLKIHPYQKYRFGPYYTKEYMGKAIVAIYHELASRDNLNIYQINGLQKMADLCMDLKMWYQRKICEKSRQNL